MPEADVPTGSPLVFAEAAPRCEPLRLASLPSFLRVLLVTDGTVTRTLEAYFGEPITVRVLSHAEVSSEHRYPAIDVLPGDSILRRRVILQGGHTRAVYAFAETAMVVARLPQEMRRKLVEERKGIGELIRDGRLETYRELSGIRRGRAGPWAGYLGVEESASVAIRRYVICLGGRAAMEIEEAFPEGLFSND